MVYFQLHSYIIKVVWKLLKLLISKTVGINDRVIWVLHLFMAKDGPWKHIFYLISQSYLKRYLLLCYRNCFMFFNVVEFSLGILLQLWKITSYSLCAWYRGLLNPWTLKTCWISLGVVVLLLAIASVNSPGSHLIFFSP